MRNYTSLFPNIGISYSDQENHALSLSLGRRITRPNYQSLNPFEEKLSVLIPCNMQIVNNNGLSVSYPQKVTKWWEFSTYLIYNNVTYSGDLEGTVIDLKADIVNLRIQNNLKLPLGSKSLCKRSVDMEGKCLRERLSKPEPWTEEGIP